MLRSLMQNPKTTIPGLLLVLAAAVTVIAHAIEGKPVADDVNALYSLIVGAGLVGAADGGR